MSDNEEKKTTKTTPASSSAKTTTAKKTTSATKSASAAGKSTAAKTTAPKSTASKPTTAKTTAVKSTATKKTTAPKKEPVVTPVKKTTAKKAVKATTNAEAAPASETAPAAAVAPVAETVPQTAPATENPPVTQAVAAFTEAAEAAPIEQEESSEIEAATMRTISPARIVAKRFFRSKLSVAGLVVLIALFVFSFVGPLFSFLPFVWPEKQSEENARLEEHVTPITVTNDNGEEYIVYVVNYSRPTVNGKPSTTHWLGTDGLGFDVFSRLMYGGRISLTLGFVVIILETLLGILFGGLAGYFGKWVDQLIMRIVDIFSCVPTMPMLMIVGVALQQRGFEGPPRLYILMAMLTLFGWASTARLVRGQILSLREQDFMISAEASGLPVWRKIFKHLIPNVVPQLIVTMTLGLGSVILMESTLGYLGIGLDASYATWGNMISAASDPIVLRLYPNQWIAPGICIVLAVLAFNFVGDGLRDAFDPKSRR